jgi:hypothetical protein
MVPLCQQGWGRKGDTYRVGIRNSNSVVDATNISNKRLIKMFIIFFCFSNCCAHWCLF